MIADCFFTDRSSVPLPPLKTLGPIIPSRGTRSETRQADYVVDVRVGEYQPSSDVEGLSRGRKAISRSVLINTQSLMAVWM